MDCQGKVSIILKIIMIMTIDYCHMIMIMKDYDNKLSKHIIRKAWRASPHLEPVLSSCSALSVKLSVSELPTCKILFSFQKLSNLFE